MCSLLKLFKTAPDMDKDKEKEATVVEGSKATKGAKRKVDEMEGDPWVPFVHHYNPSREIEPKYLNTPYYMSDVGWLPHWGLKEAVRELLANTIDQARKVATDIPHFRGKDLEFSERPGRFCIHIGNDLLAEARWSKKVCKFVKKYANGGYIKLKALEDDFEKVETYCLELINYASSMRWKSFNVGYSSKRDNKNMIGKHGEGLSGASVVLNRAGCNLFADCSHYNYTASVLNIDKGVYYQLKRRGASKKKEDLPQNAVRFTIVFDPYNSEVDPEELMNCVRLPATAAAAGVATARGMLLLDAHYRGKQFNRSIFVAEEEKCLFGYDFLDPDKNLLQGRDRNAHGKDRCLQECGAILSEAILQSEEVRREVLGKCFLYSAAFRPSSPGDELLRQYEDIRDGQFLSRQALDALRAQHERDSHAGQRAIFCERESLLLKEIQHASDMCVAYSHRALHNHASITETFLSRLTENAHELSPTSRVGAHAAEIAALLKVAALKDSVTQLTTQLTGFWKCNNVVYVTSAAVLGDESAVGMSEAQEVNIVSTLHACGAEVKAIVKIVRLLRNQPEPVLPVPLVHTPATSAAASNHQDFHFNLSDNCAEDIVSVVDESDEESQDMLVVDDGISGDIAGEGKTSEEVRQLHRQANSAAGTADSTGGGTSTGGDEEPAELFVDDVFEFDDASDDPIVQSLLDVEEQQEEAAWEERDINNTPTDTAPALTTTATASATGAAANTTAAPATDTPAEVVSHDPPVLSPIRPVGGDSGSSAVGDLGSLESDFDLASTAASSDRVDGGDSGDSGAEGEGVLHWADGTTPAAEAVTAPAAATTTNATDNDADMDVVAVAGGAGGADSDVTLPLELSRADLHTTNAHDSALDATFSDTTTDTIGTVNYNHSGKSSSSDSASGASSGVGSGSGDCAGGQGRGRCDSGNSLLPDLPARITIGGDIALHRLSRHLSSGVWLYGEHPSTQQALASQLKRCLPRGDDHRRLLVLSELLHIVVFSSAHSAAPLSVRVSEHCVCVNIGEGWCDNERIFKHFLRAKLKGQIFI